MFRPQVHTYMYAYTNTQIYTQKCNNRMRKTRNLQENWRYQFHARMGTINDRNCKDLREAEEIKNRWQEYRDKLYKERSP